MYYRIGRHINYICNIQLYINIYVCVNTSYAYINKHWNQSVEIYDGVGGMFVSVFVLDNMCCARTVRKAGTMRMLRMFVCVRQYVLVFGNKYSYSATRSITCSCSTSCLERHE